MSFNYRKLRGRIREFYGTQDEFAKVLGISSTSLSKKLNNRTGFTQSEIDQSLQALKIAACDITEYFFTP